MGWGEGEHPHPPDSLTEELRARAQAYHPECIGRAELPAGARWHCGAPPRPRRCASARRSAARPSSQPLRHCLSGRHFCVECLEPSVQRCATCPAAYCADHPAPGAAGAGCDILCAECLLLVHK